MNDNGKFQPTPGDGWVPGCFQDNRNRFPREQLIPYEGKYIAWSLDGTRIIVGAETREALWARMDEMGIPSSHYVVDWIDDAESFGSC